MRKTVEEIKSLIVVGGMVAVGYVFGNFLQSCTGSTSGVTVWAFTLFGTLAGIFLVLRRMAKELEKER